jgi:predicted MPP superfamily phosphohydrolase
MNRNLPQKRSTGTNSEQEFELLPEFDIPNNHPGNEEVIVLPQQEFETRKAGPSVKPVSARILWPALGFPAVVAPGGNPSNSQMLDGDARSCICILLLTDRKYLSKEEAARHLRYVRWEDRGRRFIAAGKEGSFAETDIAIRNDITDPKLTLPGWKDLSGTGVAFGANREGEHGVVVNLSDHVRNFYRKAGLEFLHEIRINGRVTAKLKEGQYHLFWNNENIKEDAPSDEMKLLLERYARARREGLSELWDKHKGFLLGEYEYEYGSLQRPYSLRGMRKRRTEVLHPLFVQREPLSKIKIGHLTDLHVDVRADVYEENLRKKGIKTSFNNWNKSFEGNYKHARLDSDILLLTGDLIDYGRGHWGLTAADQLGDDRLYHVDRNWFLFYYLLASGNAYQKPAYTILGNHDWRLNPYPPFAIAGAPGPATMIHNHRDYSKEKLNEILRNAHGDGADRKFSYYMPTEDEFVKKFWESGQLLKSIGRLLAHKKTLDEPHTPVQTTVESIGWYLMAINPFLDYSFSLPGDQKVLMLDWAEDEDLLFPIVQDGKEWPYMLWQLKEAADPGPKAKNCLTKLQQQLVKSFVGSSGRSKIIGIHAAPIGPYPNWYDYPDLFTGKKVYAADEKARGPKQQYGTKTSDGRIEKWNGHPIFAVSPDGKEAGTVADYGSFQNARNWFLKYIGDQRSGVRLVLSGHIHRNGLFVVRIPGKEEGSAIAGKMLVRGLLTPQATAPQKFIRHSFGRFPFRYPLFINTTSAGPRGNFNSRKLTEQEKKQGGLSVDPGYAQVELSNDGTIHYVEFRFARNYASPPTSSGTSPRKKEVTV